MNNESLNPTPAPVAPLPVPPPPINQVIPPPPPLHKPRPPKKSLVSKIISFIPVAICTAALILVALYRVEISDYILGIGFTPDPDVQQVWDSINPTPRADLILRASRPVLLEREAFALACVNENVNTHILGCYDSDGIINIYDIRLPELDGIRESTLAHELLHAVYARLSLRERNRLEPLMRSAYEEHKESLEANMELYTADVFLDELHSRLGTQISDLSPALTEHYARFFNDRPQIITFFNNYDDYLQKLIAERDQLRANLDQQLAVIDIASLAYHTATDQLKQRIDQYMINFNDPTYPLYLLNAEYNIIVALQQDVNRLYTELRTAIEKYNKLVDIFNQHVLQLQFISDSISSTQPPPDIPDNVDQ